MLTFRWSALKNELLRLERKISFDDIELAVEQGNLLDILAHPNQVKYPGQKILVVRVLDYVYLVPFVQEGASCFLKTIIPSRKATKQYLGGEHDEED